MKLLKAKIYITSIALSLVVLFGVTMVVIPSASVSAATDARGQVCGAIGGCRGGSSEVAGVIRAVINVLSAIGGIIAVIMIIIGGVKYMTSSGDSNSATSARNTILYAIVGLIVVAFSQVIVQFVLQRV